MVRSFLKINSRAEPPDCSTRHDSEFLGGMKEVQIYFGEAALKGATVS